TQSPRPTFTRWAGKYVGAALVASAASTHFHLSESYFVMLAGQPCLSGTVDRKMPAGVCLPSGRSRATVGITTGFSSSARGLSWDSLAMIERSPAVEYLARTQSNGNMREVLGQKIWRPCSRYNLATKSGERLSASPSAISPPVEVPAK